VRADPEHPGRTRAIARAVGAWFEILSGWFLLRLVFGGAAGFLFEGRFGQEPAGISRRGSLRAPGLASSAVPKRSRCSAATAGGPNRFQFDGD